jgi:hypothetical protein
MTLPFFDARTHQDQGYYGLMNLTPQRPVKDCWHTYQQFSQENQLLYVADAGPICQWEVCSPLHHRLYRKQPMCRIAGRPTLTEGQKNDVEQ